MSTKMDGVPRNKPHHASLHELSTYIVQDVQVDLTTVENVVHLLENGNTVPFIARYRRDNTGNLEVEKIRMIQESLTQAKRVEDRKESIVKAIGNKLTSEIECSLKFARTLPEVEDIYAPLKKGSQISYANRARKLGLDKAAEMIQAQPGVLHLNMFIKPKEKGLSNTTEVAKGVQHILADNISKDKDTCSMLKDLFESSNITLDTKVHKKTKSDKKYKEYHQSSLRVSKIKAHHVLAINRAEESKVIAVKLNCPSHVQSRFLERARKTCISPHSSAFVRNLMNSTLTDCLNRLMLPKLIRHKKAELAKKAEHESVQIFARNLRRLLLTPPLQRRTVLGIDPGFTHGCKLAVVDHNGDILDTGVIYPFPYSVKLSKDAELKLQGLLTTNNCYTIALGNGKACRETECFITKMKEAGKLRKELVYSIINEDGASVYSVSKVAATEMPQLDVNIRSAVSIARRLQNPLLELIKVEPKHLGVGMYQHDIPEHLLKAALDGVLEDCVSLVGVDLNASGVHVLKRIAGLNEKKAIEIVEWRKRNGAFRNREQLKQIRGIGDKMFEQCAGFVRILDPCVTEQIVIESDEDTCGQVSGKRKAGESKVGNNKKRKHGGSVGFNKLDSTSIHPESYPIAKKLVSLTKASICDIGTPRIKTEMDNLLKTQDISSLSKTLNSDTATVQFIITGLCQSSICDVRKDFAKPLFRSAIVSINDIVPNVKVTGRVTNVTTFGAFVDIGVEKNGLIHTSKMPAGALDVLGVGDIVEVNVEQVNRAENKIQLRMLNFANVKLL